MTMYTNTFIQVAPDSPAISAIVPEVKGESKTVAVLEHELLSHHPYTFTNEELIFEVYVRRQGLSDADIQERRQELWDELFSKSHACMRASALTKRYGWGVHYDQHGKMALYPLGSDGYERFVRDTDGLKLLVAMRSKRV
jgi:Family of unknown function (DUF6157)